LKINILKNLNKANIVKDLSMNQSKTRKILYLSKSYPQKSFECITEDSIYACINPPKHTIKAGRAIRLPQGKFDIRLILDQLPSNWKPDLIFMTSSLARVNNCPIPTGFQNLSCPSILKLYDSHYPGRQIQKLIEYAKAVNCKYNYVIYDRHHLHFYQEAGLLRLFWMPSSFSIPVVSDIISQVPTGGKLYDVIFCGSIGNNHPYRARLLNLLKKSGINVTIARRSYKESLQAYAEAKIVFNCSMNGDLNRRVFEVLMAGGFLLTDRLSTASGLSSLFQEGVHLDCYGSEQELLDKVRYYLAHPERRVQIGSQGHEKFMSKYHPNIIQEKFYNFVIGDQPIPELFLVKDDSKLANISNISNYTKILQDRIRVYELFQEIHRINSKVILLYYQGKNQALVSDLKDLPRLQITLANSAEEVSNHDQMLDVVMVDSSPHQSCLKDLLEQLDCFIPINGLLIILGKNFVKKESNILLGSSMFVPIKLIESGEGACFSYQKLAGSENKTNLTLNVSSSLPRKFLKKIKLQVQQIIKV
jgi:hypothetical protein